MYQPETERHTTNILNIFNLLSGTECIRVGCSKTIGRNLFFR